MGNLRASAPCARVQMMHLVGTMATTVDTNLHDHAGIRWLLPFLAVIALVAAMVILMMLYPHG